MICGLGRDRLEETRAGSVLGVSPACCILVGELLRGERADFSVGQFERYSEEAIGHVRCAI